VRGPRAPSLFQEISSSSWPTSCSRGARSAPPWTASSTSDVRQRSNWRSWSIGGTASCRSKPRTSEKTFRPRGKKTFRSCSKRRARKNGSSFSRREADGAMSLKRKDLLSLAPLSAEEITLILQTADSFKEVTGREIKKVPALRGRTVVNLFFEPSTRTRTSFELAAKRLSADVINFSPSSSSVVKGETLLDTARNIEAMQADIIVLRHPSAGAAEALAAGVKSSVINAGDGWHEHPTQALLDLYTI